MNKHSVWVIYAAFAAAIVFGSGWISTAGHVLVWLTIAVHIAEFVAKRPLFAKVGGSSGHHFVQTLIYGLFHWKPLEAELDSPQPAPETPAS